MKALSVKQPWANMIASGEKTIETRTWMTGYRGQVLIVSSKQPRIEPARMRACRRHLDGLPPHDAEGRARGVPRDLPRREGMGAGGDPADRARPGAGFVGHLRWSPPDRRSEVAG